MALYEKGESGNPNGRRKGSRNRLTQGLKDAYLGAFDALGGEQGLIAWGKKNPDLFYGQISKLLPKGIEIKTDQELTINIISNIPEPLPLPAKYAKKIEKGQCKCVPPPAG